MSVPASARESGFLGIPERSVQRKVQMQLLVLQGENKSVYTFTITFNCFRLDQLIVLLLLGKEW